MDDVYDVKKTEKKVTTLWQTQSQKTLLHNGAAKPFSMYLIPPNASGPMHIGNAFMIALQDIIARYHRVKGDHTLWIPSIDHGGYETQVTFEREQEQKGIEKTKEEYRREDLYTSIEAFVAQNVETIIRQINTLGASVDWSRYRFTLDDPSRKTTEDIFAKMVSDRLIYRESYMVHYCTECATVLADIELKKTVQESALYHIRFAYADENSYVTLAITRPEFLYAVTHVLVHPEDSRYAHYIGRTMQNPVTGEKVEVVASKRKLSTHQEENCLSAFCPSYKRYDYEYAIRHNIPARDLLDWNGRMAERYIGDTPEHAREKELAFLVEHGLIENADHSWKEEVLLCKKGHTTENIIRLTWFVKLDDERTPLRKTALATFAKEKPHIYPVWREKGLLEWIQKMHDWPIARQNVWGIRIPIWYEVTDPAQFRVWFFDTHGARHTGTLDSFLHADVPLDEIIEGLQRVYASGNCTWTLYPEQGKQYLPETDTFDTWFSSGAWSAMVHSPLEATSTNPFYPNDPIIIGHDLLRLSIAREIVLGVYLTGRLPFRKVYFHQLLKGSDGQKMSKSVGNAVTLDHYFETYGADVTRMALVSYTASREDFFLSEERLLLFQDFSQRLWKMGRVYKATYDVSTPTKTSPASLPEDQKLIADIAFLARSVGSDIEKLFFARAQEKVVEHLKQFEVYTHRMLERGNTEDMIPIFQSTFEKYLIILHPFMPFITEAIAMEHKANHVPLIQARWPITEPFDKPD
jgi:valyl-tRNA synthetase